MPWNNAVEYPFNAHFINECAPVESGVYALCAADKWVYIGDAANLKQELLSHLEPGRNPQIDEATPTTFSFELCSGQERVRRRERLIAELHPMVALNVA